MLELQILQLLGREGKRADGEHIHMRFRHTLHPWPRNGPRHKLAVFVISAPRVGVNGQMAANRESLCLSK